MLKFQEQKPIKKEISSLKHLLDVSTNKELRYKEEILEKLKNQLFSNKNCVQINNKISELKSQNKEHVIVSFV